LANLPPDPNDGVLTSIAPLHFFEQRRWRHFDEEPDDHAMGYIRALVEAIRAKVSAGITD
jgi:hypothetical protein